VAILGEARDKALWVGPVDEIVLLHHDILGHARQSLNNAIRIGEILSQVKGALKHGEWLPWIKEFAPFSIKTAERYMACFENKEKIANLTNLTDAYVLVLPNASNGAEPQQLHEPNFHSQAVRLEQNLVGLFTHYLQRRPLKSWQTEEVYDLLCSLKPLHDVVAMLESELGTRHDLPASYRSQNAN